MISQERRSHFLQHPVEADLEKTVQELQPSAPGAEIREGKLLNDGSKQAIENWVKSL